MITILMIIDGDDNFADSWRWWQFWWWWWMTQVWEIPPAESWDSSLAFGDTQPHFSTLLILIIMNSVMISDHQNTHIYCGYLIILAITVISERQSSQAEWCHLWKWWLMMTSNMTIVQLERDASVGVLLTETFQSHTPEMQNLNFSSTRWTTTYLTHLKMWHFCICSFSLIFLYSFICIFVFL